MGKIIVVANQKGGVGKTTTSVNLSASLAKLGKNVLGVDCDPQGNMTSGLGVDKSEVENSIYELLLGEADINECIIKNAYSNMSLLPASVNLSAAELDLAGVEMKEFILKEALAEVRDRYDYIIIDCPPSLNVLTINAMCAAESVLVPIQCEYYALEGLSQLLTTINLVSTRMNTSLEIEGIVFTMYDARNNLSQQVVDNVKENLDYKIFKSIIPRNVRLAEAPSYGMPVIDYDPRSSGAEAYIKLAREVIRGGRKKK